MIFVPPAPRRSQCPFPHEPSRRRSTTAEYQARVERVKERMERQRVDVLVSADPANMNYLTGYDANSYYIPQAVVVAQSLENRCGSAEV